MRLRLLLPAAALLAGAAAQNAASCGTGPGAASRAGFYEQKVRPLLAARCLSCHGEAAKGGLRLDSAAGWLGGGASGPAIRPGDPDGSLLLRAVRRQPGAPAMPPGAPLSAEEIGVLTRWIRAGASWSGSKPPLTPPTLGGQGGASPGGRPSLHWSFRPVRLPAVPRVKDRAWVRTPIDAFVLAKLEARGLHPSPPADPRTLIRRVTYDLTGLPPTPEEVDAFLRDCAAESLPAEHAEGRGKGQEKGRGTAASSRTAGSRPAQSAKSAQSVVASPAPSANFRVFRGQVPEPAYQRLVERLLASPAYGERWARHWLDVVHYADTHGYDKDKRRDHAWPYRDYVIRSLNQDKPFDRFVQEQLAGDVLWPDSPDGVVATGFIAAGPWDFVGHLELREGTVEKAKTRVLDRDDMVTNALGTFCSLTVQCARCHDHKFDPISQREYYRLQAVFAGVDRGERPRPSPERPARQAALEARRKELLAEQRSLEQKAAGVRSPELDRLDAEIEQRRRELAVAPRPEPGPASPTNGYHSAVEKQADTTKWVQVDLGKPVMLDRIRLIPARPTDFKDTPGFGFPVRYQVAVSDEPAFQRAQIVADRSSVDFPNPGLEPVVISLGGKTGRYVRVTAARLWPRTGDFVFALAELEAWSGGVNVARGAAVTAKDSIESGRWSARALVDGFDSRNQLPEDRDAASAAAVEHLDQLREALWLAETRRRDLAGSLLDPETRAGLAHMALALADLDRELAALAKPEMVYGVVSHEPAPISLLARGEVEQPKEPVTPGALACLAGMGPELSIPNGAPEGARRAALARWITDPKNPLTPRSLVNRVWQYHFGQGLVDTPSDFGRHGSLPTHPELLDWLAYTFTQPAASHGNDGEKERGRDRASETPDGLGWSLKKLHRLIVLSSTYRQSSSPDPSQSAQSAKSADSSRPNPQSRVPFGRRNPQSVDAGNRLLWRMDRRRLEAEEVRDAVLAVSGKLDRTMGGPGFELFRFKDDHSPVYDHTDSAKADDPRTFRRTVYRFTVRSVPNPFLECLDCADPNVNTPVRSSTLTALQALALLNDPFMVRQAEYFAERVRQQAATPEAQVDAACALALSRPPRPAERRELVAYLRKHGLAAACRVLLNSNEFLFVD